jgi:hypothetical protein
MLNCTDYIGQHVWNGIVIPVPPDLRRGLLCRAAKMAARRHSGSAGLQAVPVARLPRLGVGTAAGSGKESRERSFTCGYKTNFPPSGALLSTFDLGHAVKPWLVRNLGTLKIRALLLSWEGILCRQHEPDEDGRTRIEKELRSGTRRQPEKDAGGCRRRGPTSSAKRTRSAETGDPQVFAGPQSNDASLSALEQHSKRSRGPEPKIYEERRPVLEGCSICAWSLDGTTIERVRRSMIPPISTTRILQACWRSFHGECQPAAAANPAR